MCVRVLGEGAGQGGGRMHVRACVFEERKTCSRVMGSADSSKRHRLDSNHSRYSARAAEAEIVRDSSVSSRRVHRSRARLSASADRSADAIR